MGNSSCFGGAALARMLVRTQDRVGRLPVEGRYHHRQRRLQDDYVLESAPLGRGRNGEVLAARNRLTGARAAVKTYRLHSMEEGKREELLADVEICLSLDFPHVVRLYDVYESRHEVSLVMECLEGGELFDRLDDNNRFSEEDAAHATWQMLLAVNYLHSRGIVHRDVKMDNVMFDQKGSKFLKIVDFGFGTFFEKGTKMKEMVGTSAYVAPEVLAESYSCGSCDLWSLGVIVFILLSGYMPFGGPRDSRTMRAIKRCDYKMHKSEWDPISEAGRDFVQRLLVGEPRKRMTAEQALTHPWLRAHAQQGKLSLPSPVEGRVAEALASYAKASRFQQACWQLMAWSLTPEQRREMRAIFLELDTRSKKTGVIEWADLQSFLSLAQLPEETVAMICETVATLNCDQSEGLNFSKFLAAMLASRLETREQVMLHETFRRFDKENRGYLTPRRMKRMLGNEVTSQEVEHVFRMAADPDTGHITSESFIAFFQSEADLSSACGDWSATSADSPVSVIDEKAMLVETETVLRRMAICGA